MLRPKAPFPPPFTSPSLLQTRLQVHRDDGSQLQQSTDHTAAGTAFDFSAGHAGGETLLKIIHKNQTHFSEHVSLALCLPTTATACLTFTLLLSLSLSLPPPFSLSLSLPHLLAPT